MTNTETAIVETVAPAVKLAKTSTITLTAHGSTMQIVVERQAEGARTYVLTVDAAKKSERGMTERHATWDAAKAHSEALATKAIKAGWTRRVATKAFVAKPDAFSTIPAAPTAAHEQGKSPVHQPASTKKTKEQK